MLKKFLIAFLILLLIVIIALLLAPLFFKKEINQKVKQELNNDLNAKIDYADYNLTFFQTFPNLRFSMDGLTVVALDSVQKDTLASISNFNFTIDLRSVIKGDKYQVLELNIVKPFLHIQIDSTGKSNWDILKIKPAEVGKQTTGSGQASNFKLDVLKYEIEKGRFNYEDKRSYVSATAGYFDFKGKGEATEATYNLSGSAKILNLVYQAANAPSPVEVKEMQLSFTPQSIALDTLTATTGKSDITASGKFENVLAYFSGKGDIKGILNLHSNVFDLNERLQKNRPNTTASIPQPVSNAPATKSTGVIKPQYYPVPAHLDITANATFGKVYYEKLIAENVKGRLVVKDEAININDLSGGLLKGTAKASLKYETKGTDHPKVSFAYSLSNFDIQETFKSVETAQLASAAKNMRGSFSSELSGKGRLNPDMNMDYNSLEGDGNLVIPDARITDQPVLTQIGAAAKTSSLSNLEMKNVKASFRFKSGKVVLAPTDVKFTNGFGLNIQGTSGFDKTVDYDLRLDVPIKEFGSVAQVAQNLLSNLFGSSAPDAMSFYFKLKGKGDKPDLKLIKAAPASK